MNAAVIELPREEIKPRKNKKYPHLPKGINDMWQKADGTWMYRWEAWERGGKKVGSGVAPSVEQAAYDRRMKLYQHHWEGMAEDREEYFGFTYTITDRRTGRMYLGAKQFYYWDGPVRGYKCTDPRDEDWDPSLWKSGEWRKYTSSSKVVARLIGDEPWHFEFKVNRMHRNKLDLFHAELREQIEADVLNAVDANGDYRYLNEQIMGVEYRPPVPKAKLRAAKEAGLQAAKEYYLRPDVCTCGEVIPFGETKCTKAPVFGSDEGHERVSNGSNS